MSGKRGGARVAGPGKRNGRPPKALGERKAWAGKIAVRVDPDTALLAQRLMLHEWEGVRTVDELFAYALRRLAETMED